MAVPSGDWENRPPVLYLKYVIHILYFSWKGMQEFPEFYNGIFLILLSGAATSIYSTTASREIQGQIRGTRGQVLVLNDTKRQGDSV